MRRLLWLSDVPTRASGFALGTREVCQRLARLGYEIEILGWWSREETTYCGMRVTPCPTDPASAARLIVTRLADFRPDFLVTLADIPWVGYVASACVQRALSRSDARWVLHYPVDGVLPDGTLPRSWSTILSSVDVPVTMSGLGVSASVRSGIDAALIPHGCDTEMFRPPPCKNAAKRRLAYEGKFVVLSDVRNHRRKLIPRTLDILRRLRIPRDRLVLHLHTSATPREDLDSYRYDLRTDLELLGLDIVRGVRQDGVELSMSDLAALYAAADVHLLTSFGEGFGLPTLQAASAGVVPIVPANSASTELVGDHGFAVPCESWTRDEFGLARGFIDRQHAASVLELLYEHPDLLRARSVAARRFALEFTWDRVATQWDQLLRHAALLPRTPRDLPCLGLPQECDLAPQAPRPTGHDASVLPLPRIGMPTRLDAAREDALEGVEPFVLAERSCVDGLRALERLFPGTHVLEAGWPDLGSDFPHEAIRAALVVDPDGRLGRIDEICAMNGVSFLGRSRLWPKVVGHTLVAQARLLLTDYALAERRAAVARRRAGARTQVGSIGPVRRAR
jgi:glycosyltransferase involved in cell wall biosynthesis